MPVSRAISASLASLLLICASTVTGQIGSRNTIEPLDELVKVLPAHAAGFNSETVNAVRRLVPAVEAAAETYGFYPFDAEPPAILATVEGMVDIKRRADELLGQTVALRTEFVNLPPGDARREAVRSFLATTAELTELSGRLRYLSYDVISDASFDTSRSAADSERLVDVLLEGKSSIGAVVMADALFDPPAESDVAPLNVVAKTKIMQLIRDSRQNDLLGQLARFVRQPDLRPEMAIWAAITIRTVGLPQDPLPDREEGLPDPEITAGALYDILAAIDASRLRPPWPKIHANLLAWLDQRRREGVSDEEYRLGSVEVRPGDWLLMRNPSPYNLFTDLHPGLFTHVGVVTARRGADGIRRFLIVDLRERGNRIPAVTIDTFVKRTLDYVVLRHADPSVGKKMGEVAASIIGNESKFDLNFRTDGITRLKGQDLRGKKIEGYCAGLLLLCAQETTVPVAQFFPIPEHPAGGKTLANLAKIDVSMQSDFYSPTGALFSPQLQIVGRREPMYSPTREIEQAIYDHFALQLRFSNLTPSRDWYQSLRLSLAEASKGNPLLAHALADAAGVNRNMDLVAAAKLGAVVETLDEIAYGASGQFVEARDAIRSRPPAELRQQGLADDEIEPIVRYRQRHAALQARWEAEELSPRDLRVALVSYYIEAGKRELDERFFRKSE